MTNEKGEELTSSFDDANRRTGSSTESGGANAGIEYDEAGNPIKQTTPTGGVITWKYDDDGRPIGITEPRGNVAGNDPDDYTTKYTYDLAGNPETMTDPLGNVTRSPTTRTTGWSRRPTPTTTPPGSATTTTTGSPRWSARTADRRRR